MKRTHDDSVETLAKLPYPHSLRRRARRTLGIKVTPEEVVFAAPQHMPHAVIYALIGEKAGWIDRQRAALARRPRFHPPDLAVGGAVIFQDRRLALRFIAKQRGVTRRGTSLYLPQIYAAQPEQTLRALTRFMRAAAQAYARRRAPELARGFGLSPRAISCRSYRARWGSCSHQGDIRLNWQLIIAPPCVFDYVIAHELAHLAHMNHSRDFWDLVARLFPDYAAQRDWLNARGHLLRLS